MTDTKWVDDDGHEVALHKVDEDTTVYVDGRPTPVSKGDLLIPADNPSTGYYSFNQTDWKNTGFHAPHRETKSEDKPPTSTAKKAPAKRTAKKVA